MADEWVEIEWLVAEAEERRADLPADTRRVAYQARTRGIAPEPVLGDITEVLTPTQRRQVGRVVSIRPGYTHTFGTPLDPWIQMREAIRVLVHGVRDEADPP